MLTNAYLITNVQNETSAFVLQGERILWLIVASFEIFLEIIAILIIVVAIFIALQRLLKRIGRVGNYQTREFIRLELGTALVLSLEFLLAADIVGTAVSPSWDAIGKLGAVTGIRNFLNFFLQKEVKELEAKTRCQQKLFTQDLHEGSKHPLWMEETNGISQGQKIDQDLYISPNSNGKGSLERKNKGSYGHNSKS